MQTARMRHNPNDQPQHKLKNVANMKTDDDFFTAELEDMQGQTPPPPRLKDIDAWTRNATYDAEETAQLRDCGEDPFTTNILFKLFKVYFFLTPFSLFFGKKYF